ncbi:hypothetical protein [Nocardia callitridis]|uniref:WXG100 family type VII secretion target n=1 Tax=Nocardia callitridis TaxID=648753 RepID=A0ABP9KC85_9NOCA
MAASFEADPLLIRQASAATNAVSARVQEVIGTLQGVVAANEGGWGNDDYGSEFAKGYQPARDSLDQVTTSVREHLGRLAADEITAAEGLEAVELASTREFDQA